jgi:hypothetical protein
VEVKQVASPMEFADVDAEVVDRNVIRLDTRNVLDAALTPGADLIDPAQPVRVVWNGVVHDLGFENGSLRLMDRAYKPGRVVKNATLPGTLVDFTATPFAVVIGTTSRDPEMVKALHAQADIFIGAWRAWQKFEPRVFTDTQIKDTDIARYSLVLFGGADANRVTASFGARLPLRLTQQAVVIGGHEFRVPAAAVHMVHPNPRNSARYVWVIAAGTSSGLLGAEALPYNLPEWDFVIYDGHMPGYGQRATRTQTAVASGHFDYNWRYAPTLVVAGDAAVRARANHIRQLNPGVVPVETLDRYVGKYLLPNGRVVEVRREGSKLLAQSEGDSAELLPQGEDNFYLPPFSQWVAFQRDAAGKVTGFTGAGGGDYEAKRQE